MIIAVNGMLQVNQPINKWVARWRIWSLTTNATRQTLYRHYEIDLGAERAKQKIQKKIQAGSHVQASDLRAISTMILVMALTLLKEWFQIVLLYYSIIVSWSKICDKWLAKI